MNKTCALLLSVLVLCVFRLPASAADSPSVLGLLEIRGLESLSASAFELSKAGGQPMPKEMVSMMLHGALGSMPGMGIQPEGTVRALWLDNGTDKGGAALLLPVENEGADYLAGLGQAGWKNEAETADGIVHFTPPPGSDMVWSEVYFLKRGATLVAGPTADDVRKADAAMAALPPILPVEGDVALQIHPALLTEVFGPQIQEQMDQALKASPDAPAEAAAMGALYFRGYMAVARQLDQFALGLGVANGHLNVHTRVAPVAGTTLAKWFASMRTPSAATAIVNVPGALYAETVNLGDLALVGPAYFRYMEEMMAIMPKPPGNDFMTSYMENAKAYWEQMSGDIGIALLTPTREAPLRLVEFIGLKDSTGLRDMTRQMLQSSSEMMKAMASATNSAAMPFALALTPGEPREYRGIAVDTVAYSLTPGEMVAAMWPEGLPTKLDIEMAWIPGGVLASVGGAALTDLLVDRALDGASAPLSDLPAWKAAYPTPDKDLVDVTHLALFDAIRSYVGLVDTYTDGNNAAMIPAGPGHLESASYMAMGGLMSRVRFSLADIAAVGQKAKEAQEKAMADMMKQMEMQGQMPIEDEGGFESMDMDTMGSESWDAGADAEGEADPSEAVDVPAEEPVPAEME